MNTMDKPIRTDLDAIAYLIEHHPHALSLVSKSVVTEPRPCQRCGGSGNGGWFQDGGVCYECGGRDTRQRVARIPVKAYAQRLKRKDSARASKVSHLRRERAAGLRVFVSQNQDLLADLRTDHPIVKDIRAKLVATGAAYGLSDKQVALVRKLAGETASAEERHVDCPSGRVQIEGVIVSVKWRDSDYGGAYKATIRIDGADGSWLVWGTVPAGVLDAALEEYETDRRAYFTAEDGSLPPEPVSQIDRLLGRTVRLTATVTPSDDKPHFGFYKRPAKAELVKATS